VIGPEQGIIPDNRAPGYFSGPSFGMLGPSRVIFQVVNNTMPGWPAGRYAMPRAGQSAPAANPFVCSWQGAYTPGHEAQLTLTMTHGDPVATVAELYLYRPGIPTFYRWRNTFNDFVWNYSGRSLLPNSTGALQITAFRRLSEWVNIAELTPTPTWLEGDP
jgi:hypothetical protein